jgi:ubiquinone/menaquinone biosynthesis C-methylase UbiE
MACGESKILNKIRNAGKVTGTTVKKGTYWISFFGIPKYKINWYVKFYLYKLFRFQFAKMRSQKIYWNTRGKEYYDEFIASKHVKYEVFFQDMLVAELEKIKFRSFFEAGCGFGWNIKRIKQEFPHTRVGGIDYSEFQLLNSRNYLPHEKGAVVRGDASQMGFRNNAFDVGFSLGVFMNIHPDYIGDAIDEMIRVSRKYVIHLEWDQENTTPSLKERRSFKTNIVSHDYRALYKERGKNVLKFATYCDFGQSFSQRFNNVERLSSWEQFEGPSKYIFIMVEV